MPIATDELWVSISRGHLRVLSRPRADTWQHMLTSHALIQLGHLHHGYNRRDAVAEYDEEGKWRSLLCGGRVSLPGLGCNILLAGRVGAPSATFDHAVVIREEELEGRWNSSE